MAFIYVSFHPIYIYRVESRHGFCSTPPVGRTVNGSEVPRSERFKGSEFQQLVISSCRRGGSFFLGGRAPIWWFWWSKQGGNPCWKRAVVFIHLVDEWWYPLMRSWRFRVNSWYLTMYSHRKLARLVLFFPRSCVAGAALSQTTRTGSTDQWKKNLVGGTCPFLGRMIMMYGSPFEPSKIWIDGILPYSSYGNLLIN